MKNSLSARDAKRAQSRRPTTARPHHLATSHHSPLIAHHSVPQDQYLVLIECRDEVEQRMLLERFQGEGISCRALLS
jgi:hypothetical protein